MVEFTAEVYELAAKHAEGLRSPYAGIWREGCLAQAATLRQEDEGFDPRKFVRHMAEVLEAGGDMFKIDADLARLGAAIQAALAQNTQGVPEVEHKALEKLVTAAVLMLAEIDTCGHEVDPAYRLALYEAWEEGKAALAAAPSHSAERARVPADMVLVPCEPTREMLCAWRNAEGSDAYYNTGEGIGYCYKAMIAAAPSQRAEVKS